VISITIERKHAFLIAAFVVIAALLVPAGAWASHQFTDVPDSNIFHDDIAWLADAGVTLGCNPPTNDRFCPGDNVTRQQMAAFMHRLSDNQVVDAATAVEADHATEADYATEADHATEANEANDAKEVNGGTAWMWAQSSSPTIGVDVAADSTYAYNSEGTAITAITYERTAVGRYTVTFPGWGTIGHSMVTAYSSAGIHCQNSGWGGGAVGVSCYDSAGAAADARFNVLLFGN
jgi:hypothetical protein